MANASCLVTGGSGFVGKALCLELKKLGHDVSSLSRRRDPDLEANGVNCIQADISEPLVRLEEIGSKFQVVFHVASKVDMWGAYEDFYRSNVLGTKHVLDFCKTCRIPFLIYTSSPSVVSYDEDLCGVDESLPYPKKYLAHYPATKAIAEQMVLDANNPNQSLSTLSLRPHLIWGPGDRHLVPTILEKAKSGRLRKIGGGANLVSHTFIDDCVDAHIKAWEALRSSPTVGGRAYFINAVDPVPLWDWVNEILSRNGLKPVTRSIPLKLAMSLASLAEMFVNLSKSQKPPALTKFLVSQMGRSHYFSIDAAKRDLKYDPKFDFQRALAKTFESLDFKSD